MPLNKNYWPIQPRPDEESWSLWHKALSKSVCTNPLRNVLATRPGVFTKPLGIWLPDSNPCSSSCWTSYFSHSSQRLFQPNPAAQRPLHYQQLPTTTTHLAFSLALWLRPVPPPAMHPCIEFTERCGTSFADINTKPLGASAFHHLIDPYFCRSPALHHLRIAKGELPDEQDNPPLKGVIEGEL